MERPKTLPGRHVGNSTRLIDYYIQELYNNGVIQVMDHHEEGKHQKPNDNLYERISNRLYREHRGLYENRLITEEVKDGFHIIKIRKE